MFGRIISDDRCLLGRNPHVMYSDKFIAACYQCHALSTRSFPEVLKITVKDFGEVVSNNVGVGILYYEIAMLSPIEESSFTEPSPATK